MTDDITLSDTVILFSELYYAREEAETGSAEILFKGKSMDSLCYLYFQTSADKKLREMGNGCVTSQTTTSLLYAIYDQQGARLEAITTTHAE
jgi:hypothetical protein